MSLKNEEASESGQTSVVRVCINICVRVIVSVHGVFVILL